MAVFCPVPDEQQPINEFKDLQKAWLFKWALMAWPAFLRPLLGVWGLGLFVIVPIVASSFPPEKLLGHFLILTLCTSTLPLWFLLMQLYFGWRYIRDRLQNEVISYEESGWFDGQMWRKPEEILLRDRLIVTYQIQPFMQRLERCFLVLLGIAGIGGLLWNLV